MHSPDRDERFGRYWRQRAIPTRRPFWQHFVRPVLVMDVVLLAVAVGVVILLIVNP